jgi:hypothetical protein
LDPPESSDGRGITMDPVKFPLGASISAQLQVLDLLDLQGKNALIIQEIEKGIRMVDESGKILPPIDPESSSYTNKERILRETLHGKVTSKSRRFSSREDDVILHGVALFGLSQWKLIQVLNWDDCFRYQLRDNVALKDRWLSLKNFKSAKFSDCQKAEQLFVDRFKKFVSKSQLTDNVLTEYLLFTIAETYGLSSTSLRNDDEAAQSHQSKKSSTSGSSDKDGTMASLKPVYGS